jgi:hypothetical protein
MIATTFMYHGDLYIVFDSGAIFRVNQHGGSLTPDWTFELVAELR